MRRRRASFNHLPSRVSPRPSTTSASCTTWAGGVPQDYAEAVKWWRKAAEQGFAASQYNLGVAYEKGGGVPQDDGEAVKTYKEMTRFRESLQAMIAARSSHKLGAVTWEISRDSNVHLHWQLVAVPADLIRKGVAEAAFRVEAENERYPALKSRDLALNEQAACGDFFRVWLWADDGEDRIKGTSLVMPLPQDLRFNLQFGRRVLAKLLGLEARFTWQDCAQTEEEETRDVEAFRSAFKDWDFTLQEDGA